MILDDIVEKRKEQLRREKDNIEPQDMKEMALNSKNKNHGFKEALKEWIIRDLRSQKSIPIQRCDHRRFSAGGNSDRL